MGSAIEIRNLSKLFGNRLALDDLTLAVEPGEIFGFVGPNGAGKTTTIRILAGLLKPSLGEVLLAGLSMQREKHEIMRIIGYMPDEFGVYPDLKTWEYLDFFAACYRVPEAIRTTQIDSLLELVDLYHRKHDFVDKLSRGMKQRLSLARVLIHDPQILILDEPATGLDPRARIEMRELLLELAAMGKTIFFSTHILSDVAEICTRVGIIEAGKLAAVGKIGEIHQQRNYARKIRIVLLEDVSRAMQQLQKIEGVTSAEELPAAQGLEGNKILEILFNGDDLAVSTLLSTLVKADIPVLNFIEDSLDLEEVFLQVTKGLVT